MGAEVDRRPSSLEALDEGHVPRRTIGIERRRLEQPDEIQELSSVAGGGDGHRAEVMGSVELGVRHPAGARPCAVRVVEAPPQPGRMLDQRLQALEERLLGR